MSKKEMFELTNPQKSIWMMEQFYKGTNINNICATLIINMDVDIEKLNKAINIFIQNNKSFGLNFKVINGELKQFFRQIEEIQFEFIKLKDKKAARKFAEETAEELFDIEGDKLFKFKLFKLENNYGGFVVMTHHLISDAATMGMVGREISDIYGKLTYGEEIEEKEYSYEQYILEEKEYLESTKFTKDKQYWCESFNTIPEVATIPVASENSHADLTGKSKREEFILDIDLLTRISQFCNQNKISNFNFFMAVYAIYLSRVSNLKDFVIGTPILNRTNFKEKHTTGMFINTAPLRIKIENNIDFISFVKSIAQSSMSMLRYQKYSYQMLLEELRKTHENIPTLYDVMLSYQVTKASDKTAKIPYETDWIPSTTISNGIYIHLHDNDDNGILNIDYDYKVEKYTEKDIENIHRRILHIIEQVLENENCLEKDIEIVTQEEKNQILNVFNDTYSDYPRDKTIVDLFEEQVEKTPDNVAVVCGEKQITYRELNERANCLANHLVNQGVKANTVVGILINRSIEMIIAILATLKSGGVYIPIDPEYPEDRIKYMLEDSSCKILLSSKEIYSKLNMDVLFIDIKKSEIYTGKVCNLHRRINQDDLSYIIYTSGSTGKPKGVMLTHKGVNNLVNYCNEYVEYLKNNKYQSIVSVTTVSFDIFFFESIISLQKGLRLVIANEEEQMIPRLLVELINKENIKIMQTTPSRMKLLLNNINNKNDIKNLEYIILAGEQFPISLAKDLKKINNVTLYNGYGPSETTVFSTLTDVTNVSKMTIGNPLNNTQIYVLDSQMNICPIGVPGEIYISGDGVGKGYINHRELTQKSYLTNKFNNNSLLYKTGDLGAYNKDGTLSCLGRIDNQVKIRGQRIELEEIERVILSIPEIKNCVVAKKQDKNGHEFLCAYYTRNEEIEQEKIRRILQKSLTSYMVPQYFMELEKLPYTPNGKIDRKLLPEINSAKHTHSNNLIPTTENEIVLSKIFKEVLKQDEIGMQDDFFELGGDSLAAIELVTKIYNKLNIEIGIKEIFDNATVKQMAELVENKKLNSNNKRIIKVEEKDNYNTSFAQQRIYYASQTGENDSTLYNISGGVILDVLPDINKLEKTINKLIEKHSILRTHFELQDGKLMQKIEPQYNFKLNVKEENTKDLEKIFSNFVRPFELLKQPLFRFELAILKNKKAFLMLDMHHSISDGASLNILLKDLCNIYNDEEQMEEAIEYKDFAEWEYKKIEAGEFKQSENYWMEQFKDEIPTLNLPTSYKRNNKESFSGASEQIKIDSNLSKKINEIANKLNCTRYMICLAAYYILLHRYTEQKDIIVGTPISGRYLPEIENVVGMFVNTLALRSKINDNNSFAEYIENVRSMCLNAYDNQEYPLELINDKLDIQREDGKRRLYDTMFIFQNNAYPEFNLDGMDAKYYIPKSTVSKFDISLELMENRENSLDMRVEYCTEIFNKEYVMNFAEHYIKILQEVCNDETIRINNIDILTQKERNILKEFNNTKVEYSKNETVIKVFEKHAQMHPDEIAIIFEDKKITYKNLNDRANGLAELLVSQNVMPGNVVGILVSRSENVVISMLAALKVGCAYMIIDPSLPIDRINYMLSDSEAIALLTEQTAKYIKFKNKIFIDKDIANGVKNISIDDNIENPFSVIYTSGSTGKPKGIKTTNKGIINLVNSYKNTIKAESYNNFLSICTMSFDMFTVEIILPLLLGKTLILTTDEEHKSPIDINNIIDKYNVEIMFITPSKCNLLLMANNSEKLKKLKNIQFGGESFNTSIYNEIKQIGKHIEIYNEYGPSEITSCCSIKYIENAEYISIGKPINNTQIYILNESNNLSPVNVSGEICIAGDGVSLGYINNPKMTEKSFIKNPFGEGLIYKSGDIGKLNSIGEIEYINRKDEQIKIRGLRVELSEIEKQIIEIPEITNGAVIYRKEREYISAFICADTKLDIGEIRKSLSEKLPQYMVPKYITQIENLPISRNGKIDRKKLQQYKENIENDTKYVRPETEQQKLFCDIWEKLLNTKIGIETDIFESGADSLIAIKFKTELLALNIRVSYADIFKYKTVKEFCEHSDIRKEETLDNYDYTNINNILSKNEISNKVSIKNSSTNNILLFGATGFVGAHIVDSFIKNDKGNIYCIVRDKNKKKAIDRFLEILHFYFENRLDEFIDKRIFIINGDIYKENFNLTNAQIQELIEKVNIVINSAAVVKHFGDESEFINVNINITNNIIKFCKENEKRMLHISTLSVSGNSILEGEISDVEQTEDIDFSEKDLYKGQSIENNYTKSKFEAEKLILENIAQGLNAQILRLGNITNRYSDGKFQINAEQNAFASKIKSFISLKIIPEYMLESYLEFTPADICADVIIKILQNYAKEYTVFHIYNNNHVYINKFIELLRKNNINIEIVKDNKFKEKIENVLKEDKNGILDGIINDLDNNKKLQYSSKVNIMSEFTRGFLYKIGFTWPEIDEKYVEKYVKYLTKVKFLKEE